MARDKGQSKFSSNFEVKIAEMLDPRLLVDTKEELIKKDTWPSDGNTIYMKEGMYVYVKGDGFYELVSLANILAEDYSGWKKAAGGEGGSGVYFSDMLTPYDIMELAYGTPITVDESKVADFISNAKNKVVVFYSIGGEDYISCVINEVEIYEDGSIYFTYCGFDEGDYPSIVYIYYNIDNHTFYRDIYFRACDYQPILEDGVNIKTINGQSILGKGNLNYSDIYVIQEFTIDDILRIKNDVDFLPIDITNILDNIHDNKILATTSEVDGGLIFLNTNIDDKGHINFYTFYNDNIIYFYFSQESDEIYGTYDNQIYIYPLINQNQQYDYDELVYLKDRKELIPGKQYILNYPLSTTIFKDKLISYDTDGQIYLIAKTNKSFFKEASIYINNKSFDCIFDFDDTDFTYYPGREITVVTRANYAYHYSGRKEEGKYVYQRSDNSGLGRFIYLDTHNDTSIQGYEIKNIKNCIGGKITYIKDDNNNECNFLPIGLKHNNRVVVDGENNIIKSDLDFGYVIGSHNIIETGCKKINISGSYINIGKECESIDLSALGCDYSNIGNYNKNVSSNTHIRTEDCVFGKELYPLSTYHTDIIKRNYPDINPIKHNRIITGFTYHEYVNSNECFQFKVNLAYDNLMIYNIDGKNEGILFISEDTYFTISYQTESYANGITYFDFYIHDYDEQYTLDEMEQLLTNSNIEIHGNYNSIFLEGNVRFINDNDTIIPFVF